MLALSGSRACLLGFERLLPPPGGVRCAVVYLYTEYLDVIKLMRGKALRRKTHVYYFFHDTMIFTSQGAIPNPVRRFLHLCLLLSPGSAQTEDRDTTKLTLFEKHVLHYNTHKTIHRNARPS